MIRNRKLELEEAQKRERQAKEGGTELAEMRDSQAKMGQRNILQPQCNKCWLFGTATV